jgi:hypothetical protein
VRVFGATVACLLAVVAAVNGLAAWDRLAHERQVRSAAAQLQPGQALLGYRDSDERRFQQARLEIIPRPRVVAFGSSRIMSASTAMIGVGSGEFYNAGLSGGTVEDFIVLWSVLEHRGALPDTVVLAIDNWEFNRMHPQLRWLEWADEVSRFVDAGAASRAPVARALGPAMYRWYQLKELLSYSVFKASLSELRRLSRGRPRRGAEIVESLRRDLVPESDVAGRRALRADGSIMYERAYVDQTTEQVRGEAVRYAASFRGNLGDFQWDGERAARLELLWRDMRARGVRVVAYLPPYHPAAWAVLTRDPRNAAAVSATATFMTRLADRTSARFANFTDPATIPCVEEEFLDGSHSRDSCIERILRRLVD